MLVYIFPVAVACLCDVLLQDGKQNIFKERVCSIVQSVIHENVPLNVYEKE